MPDYRQSGHLPQVHGGKATPPGELPRQRKGITPQMRGRYPDYDVLTNADHWDAETRQVVFDRVDNVPPLRFFDAEEELVLRPFCETVTAQDREPRIPVLEMVDDKLWNGRLDGFQHADLPDDREVWRILARTLARERFAEMSVDDQHDLCQRFADGELDLGIDASNAWSVVMRHVLEAFYSHPWSWSEIGFGGPAYPRGYARLAIGMRDDWEGEEAWSQDPVSDVDERGLE